jgi:hypothetical protein
VAHKNRLVYMKIVDGKAVKTGGRKKGVPNKLTASAKEAIQNVAHELGGEKALLKFAHSNPEAFWTKLYTRIIPTAHVGSKDEPAIQHEVSILLSGMR